MSALKLHEMEAVMEAVTAYRRCLPRETFTSSTLKYVLFDLSQACQNVIENLKDEQ